MTFLWPSMLFSLLIVPIIVLLYLRMQRRRRVLAANFLRFREVQTAKQTVPGDQLGQGFRHHLPPALSMASLVILLVALARPQAKVNLPRVEGTVILVFDVSASMSAKDVQPSRMEAAKKAARDFVLDQPDTVKVGIVSFSGSGFTVQAPTNDTNALISAIDRLKPQSGTSLGQGIYVALRTIAVDAGLIPADQKTNQSNSQNKQQQGPPDQNLLAQLPQGTYPSAEIVLLSDGENNQSIDPVAAAQAAMDHHVPVYALGFGTTAGTTLDLDGFSVHTALDEVTLQQITQTAGGAYYNPQTAQNPKAIYAKLTPQLVVKPEAMEITSVLTGASILILGIGAVLSMLWFHRLP